MPNKILKSKIIVHRGKYDTNYLENDLSSIRHCLASGFSIEIDVHIINEKYYLGHDTEDLIEIHPADVDLSNVFIHLKTPSLPLFKHADTFFLDQDPVAYTRLGRQWVNAGVIDYCNPSTVICSNELVGKPMNTQLVLQALNNASWVCTKYPEKLFSLLKFI